MGNSCCKPKIPDCEIDNNEITCISSCCIRKNDTIKNAHVQSHDAKVQLHYKYDFDLEKKSINLYIDKLVFDLK